MGNQSQTQGILSCLEKLTDLHAQSLRHKQKEQQDKDRDRYRAKAKPTEITASQPEAYLIAVHKFEDEMRDDDRSGEDVYRAFVEATRGHRSGDFLASLKQTDWGMYYHSKLAAQNNREGKDAVYKDVPVLPESHLRCHGR